MSTGNTCARAPWIRTTFVAMIFVGLCLHAVGRTFRNPAFAVFRDLTRASSLYNLDVGGITEFRTRALPDGSTAHHVLDANSNLTFQELVGAAIVIVVYAALATFWRRTNSRKKRRGER
jgi:hypothetical protein